MDRLTCPRRPSAVTRAAAIALLSLVGALLVACGSSQVAPTGGTGPSGPAVAPGTIRPTTSGEPASVSGSGAPSGPDGSAPAATNAPPDSSPAEVGDPQADEACLAVVPRADVEAALGVAVSDIVALGTDPAISLSCTYRVGTGDDKLSISTAAGDPASSFQSALDTATGYGQNPVRLDGLGDQAFYAAAADRWPEEVVLTKGPVTVRLVNETSTTIGQAAFSALAATAAEAIRAEIPPAP